MPYSSVTKQRHETEVHVLLDMAVKQSQAWLVGDQIHRGASKCGNDHRVFLDAGSRLAVEFDELEQVPVDMQRMRIVAAVVKHHVDGLVGRGMRRSGAKARRAKDGVVPARLWRPSPLRALLLIGVLHH